jgi:hypothetical protein
MLIGAQAFQETPKSHAPAIILALTPNLAAWAKLQIDNALGAAGTSAAAVGLDALGQRNVLYEGLSLLGGGAILGGLVLGAVTALVIDRHLMRAAGFALAGGSADVLRLHARRGDRHRQGADAGPAQRTVSRSPALFAANCDATGRSARRRGELAPAPSPTRDIDGPAGPR